MAEIVKIKGLEDLKRAVSELAGDLKRKVIRAALRDAGGPMLRQARARAPVLKNSHPYRLPGTLKKSLLIKASKRHRGQNGEIGVYMAVRKRKGLGGKASARNPFDPFYWRFVEFGFTAVGSRRRIAGGQRSREAARQSLLKSGKARWIEGTHFMRDAFEANTGRAISIFQAKLKDRIDKANTRK